MRNANEFSFGLAALVLLTTSFGCGSSTPNEDAGPEDAGRQDAGRQDAGADQGTDSGTQDAGHDSGPEDAGQTPTVAACRAVDTLGTTSAGATGVNPSYTNQNGDALNPPTSGNIADTNSFADHYWDFDYIGLNTGAFDDTVQLTDAAGAHVGNPVVLMGAGIDYSGVTDGSRCGEADTFQVVLEANVAGTLVDVAAASTSVTTPAGTTTLRTTWMSSDTGSVAVSAGGLLTAVAENACATITWAITSDDSATAEVAVTCATGTFVACVDSGGVDTTTRAAHLPVGDIDANLPGLPSGPPLPAVGGRVGITFVVNAGSSGIGAYSARTEYDEAFLAEDQSAGTLSIEGSSRSPLGSPFAVNASTPGQTRWNDVDAFATATGIIDISTQVFTVVASGTTYFRRVNEELADGSACNIWVTNPCMPFSTTVCPSSPPQGGYTTIPGSVSITIP